MLVCLKNNHWPGRLQSSLQTIDPNLPKSKLLKLFEIGLENSDFGSEKMTRDNLNLVLAYTILTITFGCVVLFPQRFVSAQDGDDSDEYIDWNCVFGN